jgi:hypothetical protein
MQRSPVRLAALALMLSVGCESATQAVPETGHRSEWLGGPSGARIAALGKVGTDQWLAQLPNQPPAARPLPFKVRDAEYYEQVTRGVQLTETERALLDKNGFVLADHDQRHTFASVYLGIYALDLPVLITTDSILHAYHRSYGAMLRTIEDRWMADELARLLARLRSELAARRKVGVDPVELHDVDDYLRVAIALLTDPADAAFKSVTSDHHRDDRVEQLVAAAVRAGGVSTVELRGHRRMIDFSQFTPRGHYTKSDRLERYFRAMMWLGRADTGFWLTAGDPSLHHDVDPDRELRAAALLSRTVAEGGAAQAYGRLDAVYRLFVGASDNLTIDAVAEASRHAGGSVEKLRDQLAQHPDAEQRIQSSLHEVPPGNAPRAELPMLFQFFGQRFTVDSHVLSELVHDRLEIEGASVKRMMPSPFDVAAALGNDEAARMLRPELEQYAYVPQLDFLRRQIAVTPESAWEASLAMGWLSALRALSPGVVAAEGLPAAFDTTAWQRKMLATQLASWSELRHDNVLSVKESATMMVSCEYPHGYVEPYPQFYARLGGLAQRTASVLREHVKTPDNYAASAAKHFAKFAETMGTLERLADKELRDQPFDASEQEFLKRVIVAHAGCGSPVYSGWYPGLYLDDDAGDYEPTIAGVHTLPTDHGLEILHVGVGDARYLVTVVDSEDDVRAYVGPAYSYYESVEKERVTDEAWGQRLSSPSRPRQPSWLAELGGPPLRRRLTLK